MICSFSETMTSTSKQRFSTSDFAKTFSASFAVRPCAAFRTCSRSSGESLVEIRLFPLTDWIMPSSSLSSSSRSGSG